MLARDVLTAFAVLRSLLGSETARGYPSGHGIRIMDDRTNQVVTAAFKQARNRARGAQVWGWLRRRPSRLIPLDDIRTRLLFQGQRDRGRQTVPLDQIVGSEGRTHEFDRRFYPRRDHLRARWSRVGRVAYQDRSLPAISLVQIGDLYFVRDGNHRVSVARQRGQLEIDAYVVELATNVPVRVDLVSSQLVDKGAQSHFLANTDLLAVRPGVQVPVTASDTVTYDALRAQIAGHRYFMGLERERAVPDADAVGHWYDVVYEPQVTAMRRLHTATAFPRRTETSLYVAIMEHRYYLTQRLGSDPGAEAATCDYMAHYGPWCRRWHGRAAVMSGARLRSVLRRVRAYVWARLLRLTGQPTTAAPK